MVRVEIKFDNARDALGNFLGYTIGRWIGREYQVRFGRRVMGAGEFGGLALTAIGGATQFIRDFTYESDVKRVTAGLALAGLDDLVKVYVYDEPIAWFTDANTIVVKNLGAFSNKTEDWSVIVDGSSVSVTGVEGDTGRATIHLGATISKGKHDVIVLLKGARKAFSGKLVVP
jgi:hypothetical protein